MNFVSKGAVEDEQKKLQIPLSAPQERRRFARQAEKGEEDTGKNDRVRKITR